MLVTGAAGFIGSHLVDRLVGLGARVRGFDDLSTGRDRNLDASGEHIEFQLGDVRDRRAVREVMGERGEDAVEVVFHLAALGSVPRSLEEPIPTHEVNATGTLLVAAAAADAGVARMVLASSSSIYGDAPGDAPRHEELPPSPRSPYAASKAAAEAYVMAFDGRETLRSTILRLFNVYGPRQDPDSRYAAVVPRFLTRCRRGEPPEVFGDGEQQRDFTYVDDVVQAFLLAGEVEAAAGAAMNIGGGRPHSVNHLAELAIVASARRGELHPVHLAARPGDVRTSCADASRARELMGWSAGVTLEDGLRRTAAALAGAA